VHAKNRLWNQNGGSEFPIVLGAVALALTLTGPGRWSLDHAAGWRLAGWWWALAAVIVTVIATVFEMTMVRAHHVDEDRAEPPTRSTEERDRDVA
jgi:putative oxidoreductase